MAKFSCTNKVTFYCFKAVTESGWAEWLMPNSCRRYGRVYVVQYSVFGMNDMIYSGNTHDLPTSILLFHKQWKTALFTVSFFHLHFNVIQRGCPNLPHIHARFTVMQMSRVNRENSYWMVFGSWQKQKKC